MVSACSSSIRVCNRRWVQVGAFGESVPGSLKGEKANPNPIESRMWSSCSILAEGALLPRTTSPSSSSGGQYPSCPYKMTVYLPLDRDSLFPASPSFLVPSQDPNEQLSKVIKAIMKARRIVVVCGKLSNRIEWDKAFEHRGRCWDLCAGWHP